MVTLEAELPRDRHAPSAARGLVAGFGRVLTAAQLTDATLALSELVANACQNGPGRLTVRLESPAGGLRARVENGAVRFDPEPEGSLRSQVLGATTDAWGIDGEGAGAWFEIGTGRNGS
jgi:hypothetical protein